MQRTQLCALAVAAVAVPAAFFFAAPTANSQNAHTSNNVSNSQNATLRANPSFQVIGASSSGNTSTAWFHDPSTGRAIACQTVVTAAGGLTGMQCVASRLPQDTP